LGSTLLWASPLAVFALSAFVYGGDATPTSLALSTLLLGIGAIAVLFAPRSPSPAALIAAAYFAALLGIARLNGWLAAGAPEYASLAACGAVLFTASNAARSPQQARRLWTLTLLAGGLLSAIAFVDFISDPATNFGRPRPYAFGRLSAPFLSANTAATFFGVITLMALGEVTRAIRRAQSADLREWIDLLSRELLLPLLILLVSLSNVVLTASRAGVTAVAAASLVLLVWEAIANRSRHGLALRSLAMALAMALLIPAGVYLLSGQELLERFQETGSDQSRWMLLESYWAAVWLEPIFGHGLGGFEYVNTLAGDAVTNDQLQDQGAAHNLYLQWLLQTGFAGFIGAALICAYGIVRLLAGLGASKRNRSRIRAVLSILLLVGLHGMVDYAMEIPLFAWTIAWLFGLGMGMSRDREVRA